MVSVKLVAYTRDGDRLIAAASKQTIAKKPVDPYTLSEEEVEKWIVETYRRQHWSPWEFSQYTFLVSDCSRVCSHQLVRHRHASYAQLSQRYSEGYLRRMVREICHEIARSCPKKPQILADYERYADAVRDYLNMRNIPKQLSETSESVEHDLIRLASIAYVIPRHLPRTARIQLAYEAIRATGMYYRLLALGAKKEDARFVLPQMVKTTLYVSMNARELVTVFFPLRMCTHAQWEIRELAWKMWKAVMKVHPRLFRYAGPRCVFAENSQREKPVPLQAFLSGREKFTIPRCPELVPRGGIPNCLRFAASGTEINTSKQA